MVARVVVGEGGGRGGGREGGCEAAAIGEARRWGWREADSDRRRGDVVGVWLFVVVVCGLGCDVMIPRILRTLAGEDAFLAQRESHGSVDCGSNPQEGKVADIVLLYGVGCKFEGWNLVRPVYKCCVVKNERKGVGRGWSRCYQCLEARRRAVWK